MTRKFSCLGRKTMGGETRGGRINGAVARRGASVYKQKQDFDDRTTMFRLEKKILNCRVFTKTVIRNNGTFISERKDSRLITRWNN